MSKHIAFSGPMVKQFYGNVGVGGGRSDDNPAYKPTSSYELPVKSPVRRVYLFIQNNTGENIRLYLASNPASPEGEVWTVAPHIILTPLQTISFENYNGGFVLTNADGTGDVNFLCTILEAFA